jgi:hypothetical protein
MCLRLLFHLATRLAAWPRLSRREETRKTAEIWILRHQIAVLQRRQPRRGRGGTVPPLGNRGQLDANAPSTARQGPIWRWRSLHLRRRRTGVRRSGPTWSPRPGGQPTLTCPASQPRYRVAAPGAAGPGQGRWLFEESERLTGAGFPAVQPGALGARQLPDGQLAGPNPVPVRPGFRRGHSVEASAWRYRSGGAP